MSLKIKYFLNQIESPLWSFAIHDGHQISASLEPYMLLSDKERLREEDPFTATIAELPINQFFVSTSRFQLDINRKIEDSIYLNPKQAWGLNVFKNFPSTIIEELYSQHQHIYKIIDENIQKSINEFGYFIILDFHSYNAKRESPNEIIDYNSNPQINLGTYYNNEKWNSFISFFINEVKQHKLYNNEIDIRENIKFKGGYLAQHIINKYGEYGCVLSIEFRKDFMDEWTGDADCIKIESCKQLMLKVYQSISAYFNDDRR